MLINIQFLRFIAALLVVFHHMAAHIQISGHAPGWLFAFGQSAGFAGVDTFFVISGYIMFWTTVESADGADAIAFIKRRVARVYSGYWPFCLLALGLFSLLGPRYLENREILRSLMLWPTDLHQLLIPVSWTLIFEMVFYLLFTLLIVIRFARRTLLIGMIALAMVAWTTYSHFIRHAYDPGRLETMNIYEQYLAFPYLLEFLAGALLAARLRIRPGGWAWTWLAAGIALFAAGAWINDTQFGGKLIQGYYIIWRVLIFGSASVLIVAGLVRLEHESRTLMSGFSLLAGGASYALYLSHTLILAAMHQMGLDALVAKFPGWAAQATYLCLAALMVVFSMVHYRCLERPLHHAFRRWLRC